MLGSSLAWLGSDFGWCLGQMRHLPIYRHLRKSLEPWKVPYKSRIIQKLLHQSMYRMPWKTLEYPTLFQCSPSQVQKCVDISSPLQKFPYSSTLQLIVDVSRGLQKLPTSYISLWGGPFEASCDIRLVNLGSETIFFSAFIVELKTSRPSLWTLKFPLV